MGILSGFTSPQSHPNNSLYRTDKMSGDKMDVEAAEQKMKTMEHSEQHYFKSYDHHGTILGDGRDEIEPH